VWYLYFCGEEYEVNTCSGGVMTQQQLRQETIAIRHPLVQKIKEQIYARDFFACSRKSQAFQAYHPDASKGVAGVMYDQYGKGILYSVATQCIKKHLDDCVIYYNATLRDKEIKKGYRFE